jgi:hypothetical protein
MLCLASWPRALYVLIVAYSLKQVIFLELGFYSRATHGRSISCDSHVVYFFSQGFFFIHKQPPPSLLFLYPFSSSFIYFLFCLLSPRRRVVWNKWIWIFVCGHLGTCKQKSENLLRKTEAIIIKDNKSMLFRKMGWKRRRSLICSGSKPIWLCGKFLLQWMLKTLRNIMGQFDFRMNFRSW